MSDILERVLLLKNSNIFSEVKTEDLRHIAQVLEDGMYAKGDRVFDINERGDQMFFIQSGKVGISTERSPQSQEFLAILEAGNVFGEMNLLDDLPRSATAHILEDSHILSLEKQHLHQLIINYPEISFGIMKSLSLRLRDTTSRLQNLPDKNNKQKPEKKD
jgi:CRP/FNR family cyclic AMP-dependent transcriptional regulator